MSEQDMTGQELEEAQLVELGEAVGGDVTGIEVVPAGAGVTAAEKVAATLREMSEPSEDAGGLELTFASLAMGLEGALGPELGGYQESGELDAFVLAIARFLATHRSDSKGKLIVVELPPQGSRGLNPVRRLQLLDAAEAAQDAAGLPV
jgi:hypothetical protein